jgi:hypothetical protein
MDAYTIYREWCEAHGYKPPTREWWNAACAEVNHLLPPADDFDIETEQREGWGYETH